MQINSVQLSVYSLQFAKRDYNSTIPTHIELSKNLQLETRNLQFITNYILLNYCILFTKYYSLKTSDYLLINTVTSSGSTLIKEIPSGSST